MNAPPPAWHQASSLPSPRHTEVGILPPRSGFRLRYFAEKPITGPAPKVRQRRCPRSIADRVFFHHSHALPSILAWAQDCHTQSWRGHRIAPLNPGVGILAWAQDCPVFPRKRWKRSAVQTHPDSPPGLRGKHRQCVGTQRCTPGLAARIARKTTEAHCNHCRDCGGASICEHGRKRAECCDCGGASVCEHGRLRRRCRDCCNFVCEIQGCPRQDLPFSSAPSLLRHMQTMHGDNPRAVTKSKELEVRQALRDAQITFEYQHYLPFRGCGLESETAHAIRGLCLRGATSTSTWPPAWRLAAGASCWCCATTRTPSR